MRNIRIPTCLRNLDPRLIECAENWAKTHPPISDEDQDCSMSSVYTWEVTTCGLGDSFAVSGHGQVLRMCIDDDNELYSSVEALESFSIP